MNNKATWGIGIIALVFIIVFAPLFFIVMFGVIDTDSAQASTCTPATSATTTSSETAAEDGEEGTEDFGAINVPSEYVEPIKKAAEVSGLPASVVAKQIQAESNFDRMAGSSAGAKGPAQFIDSTWAVYGNGGDVYDIEDALDAYGRYMRDLADQVAHLANGDENLHVKLTLAAYNAGPGAVFEFKGIPPYEETENYIAKILAGAQVQFSPGCKQVPGATSWDGDLGDGEWTNPCPDCVFTNGYGGRNLGNGVDAANGGVHWGVDLATPGAGYGSGGPIIAPVDMVIVDEYAKDGCVWGTATEEPKFTFGFCHLNSDQVSIGQELKRGDVIGVEGNVAGTILEMTGQSVPTHLHLEIYKPGFDTRNFGWFNDRSGNLDPEPILKEKGAWVD